MESVVVTTFCSVGATCLVACILVLCKTKENVTIKKKEEVIVYILVETEFVTATRIIVSYFFGLLKFCVFRGVFVKTGFHPWRFRV